MADNYVEFSEVVPHLSDAEIAWLQNQLQPVVVVNDQEYPVDSVPDGVDDDRTAWRGPRFLRGCDEDVCWGEDPDFTHRFRLDDVEAQWGRHLWLYSDEYGSVDQVSRLVQKFLQQFRPQDCWTLTYAATCSKPRVAEFGGGAVIVAAEEIRWEDAQSIAEDALRAWKQKTATAPNS